MKTDIFNLQEMTSDDFEVCRAAGYSLRRELTHKVMAALTLPENWDMNGEYCSEFGGLFPVQVRLAPTHGIFEMVLCSPGEISDHWLLLMVAGQGKNVVCVRQCEFFDVARLNYALRVADVRHRDGYCPADIIDILAREVKP
ncbi:conjugation system SOS inhibitor PsiB [Enterobacter wuhouensis]|uniref:conjugation system SOS inhibitor PsiB n=1 Tax=Enterobacter wuhouensis TaxID=2529381 RepID=UPI002FD3D040